jgi:transposase
MSVWWLYNCAVKETRVPRSVLVDTRAQFARMVDAGFGRDEIMAALAVGRSTYYKWLALYRRADNVGDILDVGVSTGAPTKLTEAQEQRLRSWLVGRDPRQFQFDFALWTRKIGADLYFCDEATVRTDHHSGTTWAPIGHTPVVTSTGARESTNMISAITPAGAISFDVFTGSFNAAKFIEFLDKLATDTPNPIYLIIDGHPVHRSTAVADHIASLNGKITLFRLPSYSPDLNPDEWVWNNVKNDQIGKKSILGKGQIMEFARAALQRLRDTPDIIRQFFHDPALTYIRE